MDLVQQVTAGTGKSKNKDVEVEYVLIGAGDKHNEENAVRLILILI